MIDDLLASRLDELEAALDSPLRPRRPWEGTARLLAARAYELRRSVEVLVDRPASAMVVLRALAELTILTAWIEQCPRLHTVLWAAEGERLAHRDLDRLAKLAALRGRPVPPQSVPSPARRGIVARATERYRRIARDAGVPISERPRDPLLPDVRERVRRGELPELEMYDVGFAVVSAWAHSAAYTMPVGFIPGPDGPRIDPQSGARPALVRRFAISLQAAQYASVSRMAALGVEAELDLIRRTAMVADED